MTPIQDATITLADGRHLAYAEWGDATGTPVFFFHGFPHSRLWCPDEDATRTARVRLITVDRPGIGRSDVLKARRYSDWPQDVVALADALGIGQFAVVGWSAGGPYAAACAALIAPRLTGAGIISTRHLGQLNFVERPGAVDELSPQNRAEYEAAQRDPTTAAELAARNYADRLADLRAHPEHFMPPDMVPEGDRWFFADAHRSQDLFAALVEGYRQGTDGVRWEMIGAWLPWGFRLDAIPMCVNFWYGEQDPLVARRWVDFAVEHLPDCTLAVWPDAGHFGLAKHWREVLQVLAPNAA